MSSWVRVHKDFEDFNCRVDAETFGDMAEQEDDWSFVACYNKAFQHALQKIAENPSRVEEMKIALNEEQKDILRRMI